MTLEILNVNILHLTFTERKFSFLFPSSASLKAQNLLMESFPIVSMTEAVTISLLHSYISYSSCLDPYNQGKIGFWTALQLSTFHFPS